MEIIEIDNFDYSEQENIVCYTKGKPRYCVCILNIMYLRCEGSYTTLFLSNGEQILDRDLLKVYDKFLVNYKFFRISHNTIVNGKYITAVDLKSKEKKCFLGEIELKISRRMLKSLKKAGKFLPLISKNDHLF